MTWSCGVALCALFDRGAAIAVSHLLAHADARKRPNLPLLQPFQMIFLQNPVPYLLSLGADTAVVAEKCEVVDERKAYQRHRELGFKVPPLNIGT